MKSLIAFVIACILLTTAAWAATSLTQVAVVPTATGLATHGAGLIAGTNYGGVPFNLTAIAPDGSTTQFSALAGIGGEPMPIEAPASLPQYGAGTEYVGFDCGGSGYNPIFHLSADGKSFALFAVIPGPAALSSLTFDTTRRWGNVMWAGTEDGSVYYVNPQGVVKFAVQCGPVSFPPYYYEGISIMPVNATLGPFSGALLFNRTCNNPNLALSGIVSVVTQTSAGLKSVNLDTGLKSVEQLTLIPAGMNCYVSSYGANAVYGISATDMSPYAGKVLALVEDDDPDAGLTAGVYALHWDGARFVPEVIATQAGSVVEGAVFSRAGIGPIPAAQ